MTTTSFHRIVLAGKHKIQCEAFAGGEKEKLRTTVQTFHFGSVQIRYKEVTVHTFVGMHIQKLKQA